MFVPQKIYASLMLCIAFSAMTFGQDAKKETPASPIKIGISMDSLKIERWQTDMDEMQNRLRELGADVLAETADGNDDVQYEQSIKLINSGIQVLIIVPHNTDNADRIVKAAKAKHVKVLNYDRMISKSDPDLYISFDPYAVGVQQALVLTQLAPKGNYVIIEGAENDSNAQLNRVGQMYVLKPFVERGDIKIVSDTWTENWDPGIAYVNMTKAIEANPGNITAVIASNDGTAGGAIQALQEHKLDGKVLVSGQDAELASIIRIVEGTQTMTIYKPIAFMARQAAEAAVAMARGGTVTTDRSVKSGKYDVPAILLDPVAVTKDNYKQTVIKDGFQRIEMVKQGLPEDKWPLLN